jgi:TolB protein
MAMHKLALTIGLLIVMLAAVGATGSQATVPGTNGLIVFQRESGTHFQLFTVRADGSGFRHVMNGEHAAWAPDGKRVVMEHGKGLGVLDLNSGKIRQLMSRTAIYPAFSPDGKSVVFAQSTGAHNEGLWIVDANGRNQRYIAHGDGCTNTVFSPDGTQLACLRKEALFVVNVDGSGRTALVRPSFGAEGKIDWSPDGSRILFSSGRRVFTIGPDGTGRIRLTRGMNVCSESFSPDGKRILAVGNCDSDANTYLVTMNVDGSGVTRIPNTVGAHWASWGTQR